MNVMTKIESADNPQTNNLQAVFDTNENGLLDKVITDSWSTIAPFWPLKNLIAANPLAGFESLDFEDALKQAQAFFQQADLPKPMQDVNRVSIKWLQAFFDEGQASISMPQRHLGFLHSTLQLIQLDESVHNNDPYKREWLLGLNPEPNHIIAESLLALGVHQKDHRLFLSLLLSTLPGWAAHIQYRTQWADAEDAQNPHTVTQKEYLAFRILLSGLIWPEAKQLVDWFNQGLNTADTSTVYQNILHTEAAYQQDLINKLQFIDTEESANNTGDEINAQLVFCIDVRSEPFHRALEAQGQYKTYGFAGFFGLDIAVENTITGKSYASCPVLLKPRHTVKEHAQQQQAQCIRTHKKHQQLSRLYQSLKYTFTTPFSLAEVMGVFSGLWMGLKSLSPKSANKLQAINQKQHAMYSQLTPVIDSIPLDQQIQYGKNALTMMGLTHDFAPLVVFCGHGSTSRNNIYASALDCGACGGHHGAPNARILASILNDKSVRAALNNEGITIPETTLFVAANHNTTTDTVTLFDQHAPKASQSKIADLKLALDAATQYNRLTRSFSLAHKAKENQAQELAEIRANDWAQVRPEWGLAKNATFIVGPRSFTQNIDLEGRSFLHSYNWEKDKELNSLTTILTAPMVVAQWINAQYFFSSLDNIAFGGGSKVTANVSGKIGVMQGNASDLMHGLPLQSVHKSDTETYHQSIRLNVVVYAPRDYIDTVVSQHSILQTLFGNAWVHMVCYDPTTKTKYRLGQDLSWEKITA